MAPKTILITGCSVGGIGAALAYSLAKHSHHVIATARQVSKIPQNLAELPNVTVMSLDVSSATSVDEAVASVTAGENQLDVLVNNAGVGYAMPILDVDIERAKQMYEVNVWGTIRMIQAFSSLLIRSKGRIVNISTCGAVVNTPWISAYLSSKAAVDSFSEILRLELSPFGVSVTTIMAGVIKSHFHDNDPLLKLPEGSRYAGIERIIRGWATGESKPKGCTAAEFAEMVLPNIVGDKQGGLVWKGPHAVAMKILGYWLPSWCGDAAMSINQGLKELNAINNSPKEE